MKIARMHPRVVHLLIVLMVFLKYGEVEGLSKTEDEELDRQLKLLNKPAVKTITTEYGDIYDCVDFYKQPAFDHPLLKNHTYHPQMKLTTSLTKRDEGRSTIFNSSSKIGLKDGGCPMGTVPIRRITKEDLIRETNYVNQFNASYAGGIYHFSLVHTSNNNKFAGAGAVFSIHNPQVQQNQWSASVVKVQAGRDQIQAGWRVDPILYGDTRTRFFVLFKAGKTQCFNTKCPGFVIVNEQIPLDHVFPGVSVPRHVFEEKIFIDKDLINGRWWLYYGHNPIQIGYWPLELFTELKGFATEASWGGEVFSSGPTFPPMGSGRYPINNTAVDAYLRTISILDSAGNTTDAGPVSSLEDARGLYSVVDKPHADDFFRHLVIFGGPGSN